MSGQQLAVLSTLILVLLAVTAVAGAVHAVAAAVRSWCYESAMRRLDRQRLQLLTERETA